MWAGIIAALVYSSAPLASPVVQCHDRVLSDGSKWQDGVSGGSVGCDYYVGTDDCKRDIRNEYTPAEACCQCGGGINVTVAPATPLPPVDTPQPTECVDKTFKDGTPWHDKLGKQGDCEYYSKNGDCSNTKFANEYTPAQACCNCGGGDITLVTMIPATPTPTICQDKTLPDGSAWHDSIGPVESGGCNYYTSTAQCSSTDYPNVYTPSEACCGCGGGQHIPVTHAPATKAPDTAVPLPDATPAPMTPIPTAAGCIDWRLDDGALWEDAAKNTCSWYGMDPTHRCALASQLKKTYTASYACCVCGGGHVLTALPTPLPSTPVPPAPTPSPEGPLRPLPQEDKEFCADLRPDDRQWIQLLRDTGVYVGCSYFDDNPGECEAASLHIGKFASRGNWPVRDVCCACGGGRDTRIPTKPYDLFVSNVLLVSNLALYNRTAIPMYITGKPSKLDTLLLDDLPEVKGCEYSYFLTPIWGAPFPKRFNILVMDCHASVAKAVENPTWATLSAEGAEGHGLASESGVLVVVVCAAVTLLALGVGTFLACGSGRRRGGSGRASGARVASAEFAGAMECHSGGGVGEELLELAEEPPTGGPPVLNSFPIRESHYVAPSIEQVGFVEEAAIDDSYTPPHITDAAPQAFIPEPCVAAAGGVPEQPPQQQVQDLSPVAVSPVDGQLHAPAVQSVPAAVEAEEGPVVQSGPAGAVGAEAAEVPEVEVAELPVEEEVEEALVLIE